MFTILAVYGSLPASKVEMGSSWYIEVASTHNLLQQVHQTTKDVLCDKRGCDMCNTGVGPSGERCLVQKCGCNAKRDKFGGDAVLHC
jgi:hypothetical protein